MFRIVMLHVRLSWTLSFLESSRSADLQQQNAVNVSPVELIESTRIWSF